MSDNYIVLIPEDPRYVPDAARQEVARTRLSQIAPGADAVTVEVTEDITFFHCGENFSQVLCPSCGIDISMDWWQERMNEDYDAGFTLARYPMPCCGAAHTLHELQYEGSQGFGRFALRAMNANIGPLDDKFKQELAKTLGTPLRVIYVRI